MNNNPIKAVKRPSKESRGSDAVITEQQHMRLISYADDDFRDFLQLLWLTGCRPSEIAGLTVEQVKQAVNGVISLQDHKSAHRGKQRLLILSDEALTICNRRAENTTGYLFSGINGKLTANAISGRLSRLSIKAGVRNCIAYGYRHSFATDALSKGLPDGHVAALLGHSATTMLYKHYSHLTARTNLLKEAMKQVR